jgi:hypothetical protein
VRMSTFYCILILIYSFYDLEITGTNGWCLHGTHDGKWR